MRPDYEIDRIRWFLGFHEFLHAHEGLQVFANMLPRLTYENLPSFRDINKMHHDVVKRIFSVGELVEAFCQAVDFYNREVLKQPTLAKPAGPEGARRLQEMRQNGFTDLPPLNPSQVQEMYDYLADQPVLDHASRELSDLHHARKNHHVALIPERNIANCPHLFETLLSEPVLNLAAQILGATPVLINLSSWWSFAREGAPEQAQLFHMDVDDYRFCKLFIYLTDVDEESGPHTYVPTTHRLEVIEQAQARASDPDQFAQWYVEQLRKTDEEVAHYFGIAPKMLTGPAGSCMLVNTFGLHKGTKPVKADRLLCQATFGITPAQFQHFTPIQKSEGDRENIWPGAETPPMDFVTRLYFQ